MKCGVFVSSSSFLLTRSSLLFCIDLCRLVLTRRAQVVVLGVLSLIRRIVSKDSHVVNSCLDRFALRVSLGFLL